MDSPFDYTETTCGHDLPCILDMAGLNTAAFVAKSMSTPTRVEAFAGTLPHGYSLQQNYPNPLRASAFNPSTTIRFTLPRREHVTLKVFDVNGREVTTLVEGHLAAGNHAVTFASREITTGLFFYKITAGKFSQTRKAILVK